MRIADGALGLAITDEQGNFSIAGIPVGANPILVSISAQINGHNTPVGARTQMTKLQKATASGTPKNPRLDSAKEAMQGMASVES